MKNNLLNIVTETLKQDDRFVSEDGILLKNIIREQANKLDEKLISLLLDNDITREKFFIKIKDVIVFDINKFSSFINNKEFLPDSYTSFKNKIGLTTEKGDFIASSNEVVLSFPFKDCVLVGWQDKEDAKRDEIFYNEILGQDDIDRLFDKKVFTNFKRIDKDWEHKLEWFNRDENWDIKDNLIIKWNNLLALHSLKSNFAGKVKLIYIDPPYNTWSDSFNYNDKFNHSTWLTFIKNRLEIAKDLLRDDGAIFVQCDDNEQAYLKVLMDEIFGRDKFVNCIAVKMSEASWVKMNHSYSKFPKLKEYILLYKKNIFKFFVIDKYKNEYWDKENNIFLENLTFEDREALIKLEEKDTNSEKDIKFALNILKNVKKIPLTKKIESLNFNNEEEVIKWKFKNSYRIVKTAGSSSLAKIAKKLPILEQDIWVWLSKENIIFFYITDFNRETKQPRLQVIFSDTNIYKNPCDFWQDIKTTWAISDEWWVKMENWKKPEKILERIIKMATQPWDIVLDYHLWSWTTCAVAHKMWRQYIWIEQMDYIETISKERMKKVIEWEQWWISKAVNWQGGWEFVYMEIMQENERFIEEIKKAKNINDLLEIYNQIKDSEFINYKVDTWNLRIDNLNEKDFEDFKLFLIEILDKNLLYKNYSEQNDKNSWVNEEDKKINEEFYRN